MIKPIYEQWYFHRADLAQKLLNALVDGTGDPLALMGERRIGKTSFLLKDLIPAATKRGFSAVYVDLWQKRDQPLEAINYSLQEAIDELEVPATKIGRRLATPVKKIGLAGGSVDLGDEPARRRPADPYLLVDWLLRGLVGAARKPVLLVLDEIQELATVPNGENIVSAIRATITRRKEHVRAIFTGSSEVALQALLSRSRAALYEGASTLAFPHLDRAFIHFLAERANARLRRRVEEKELAAAFARLHDRPRPLIDLILLFASSDARSLAALLNDQLETQLGERDFDEQWYKLRPLHRLVCSTIARGSSVTSEAARGRYARELGRSAERGLVSPGSVASALRSLQASHVIEKVPGVRGSYRIDDPLFAEWIRRRDAVSEQLAARKAHPRIRAASRGGDSP
jgi:hypothetical protein